MSEATSPVRDVQWHGQTVVLTVAGDIDLNSSTEFQHALLSALDKGPKAIVLDLHQVPYMDSSGVASLVKLLSRSRKRDTALALAALRDRTRSLLEITRLDSVFDIYPTVEEALAER